ncbi:MAG: DJ-1 family glyoxalase III [Myxococcota bacterium]
MARVAVLLAEGFEEIEATTIIDVLRRAGIETVIVGVTGTLVSGAHGIKLEADLPIAAAFQQKWDLVALPGGMPGATTLRDDPRVGQLLRAQNERGGKLAAICAAPIALAKAGLLSGKRVTSFPGFRQELGAVEYVEAPVVIDANVITSRGPGTAIAFSLALVEALAGADKRESLAKALLA